MGIKIKNLQTGEFEKFNIPALKGEKGEPGEIEPSEKVDYIGKQHSKLRDTMNANVDYIIKTAIGEFNYLDYEGQHITATNSIDGHAKSAILKGLTLVNLYPNINREPSKFSVGYGTTVDDDNWIHIANREGQHQAVIYKDMSLFKPNTTYTVIVEVKNNTLNGSLALFQDNGKGIIQSSAAIEIGFNGTKKFLVTTVSDFTDKIKVMQTHKWYNKSGEIDYRFTIIEGDYTNINIPYFEGMQSVKMPVLTTTGKNLLKYSMDNVYTNSSHSHYAPILNEDGSITLNSCYDEPYWLRKGFYIEKGKKYTVTVKGMKSGDYSALCFGFDNLKYLDGGAGKALIPANTSQNCIDTIDTYGTKKMTCTALETGYVTRFYIHGSGLSSRYTILEFQVEEGSTATSYEPHQSNILTVNEEVELRGVGDVQDTLDCLTGEITHYIKDGLLDGTETWTAIFNSNSSVFSTKSFNIVVGSEIIYDKLPDGVNNITNNNGVLKVSTTSEFASIAVSNFIKKLKENPIPFMYCSNDVVIKTVDLSDNHVYSYKGTTHYSCSSEEGSLVPTLSVKVPTDTQLTIQEQKATTQTLLIKNMDLQQSIKEVQAMNLAFNTALYNSFNSIREEVEDIKKHVSTNENLEGSF